MGQALDRSLAGRPPGDASALHELARFCKAGGFLVCPSPGITDSLTSLAELLGAGAVAPSFRKHAERANLPPEGAESAAL